MSVYMGLTFIARFVQLAKQKENGSDSSNSNCRKYMTLFRRLFMFNDVPFYLAKYAFWHPVYIVKRLLKFWKFLYELCMNYRSIYIYSYLRIRMKWKLIFKNFFYIFLSKGKSKPYVSLQDFWKYNLIIRN